MSKNYSTLLNHGWSDISDGGSDEVVLMKQDQETNEVFIKVYSDISCLELTGEVTLYGGEVQNLYRRSSPLATK